MPRRLRPVAVALAFASAGAGAFGGTAEAAGKAERAERLVRGIAQLRSEVWHWQGLMGEARTRDLPTPRARSGTRALRRAARLWLQEARRVRARAARPPHHREWLCIHRYEGPWDAATGNGYYGGLQMDLTFQRSYGASLLRLKGTANRWSPLEQMWVAERAYRSGRGFRPWPNTARFCGLL
jgi:hypothetical protein